MAAGTVHIVQFQPHTLGDEVELVAQGYVVHPSASRALEGIHRPYCLPHAMASVPHQRKAIVVVIANIRAEGAVAELEGQPVVLAEVVCHTGTKLIAPYVVPVLAVAIVYVYGRTVVFVSANGHHLLAGRDEPVLVGGIVQHHPVGGVPEVALAGNVQALAPRETQSLVEPCIQAQVEKLATEPRTVIFCHTRGAEHLPAETPLHGELRHLGTLILCHLPCRRCFLTLAMHTQGAQAYKN